MASHRRDRGRKVGRVGTWPGCHEGTPTSILQLLPQQDGWPYITPSGIRGQAHTRTGASATLAHERVHK